MVMKFFCAVLLIGILVSCSHGRAFPRDMLAKVNFNKIEEEMDKRREEKRKETRQDKTRQDKTRQESVVRVVWPVCTTTYMIFTCFLHVMVVVPLTFHNVSFFCFSLQFQAQFHMLSNVNMWKIA